MQYLWKGKGSKNRFLASLLAVAVICASSFHACASSYTDDRIETVNELVEQMYDAAESAPQQTESMALGTMYMLSVINQETDSSQARADRVTELVSSITESLSDLDGAPQVSSLCLYGSVVILSAIAYSKDSTGFYSSYIASVNESLTEADTNRKWPMRLIGWWICSQS